MGNRRKRGQAPDGTLPAPEESSPAGDGPVIDVRMRGNADEVKRQLGVAAEKKDPQDLPKAKDIESEKEKFVAALRNPKYVIRIKRRTPREIAGHCWEEECPMNYAEIQDMTRQAHGGGSYRASIIDPEGNETIAADTFELPGEPIDVRSELSEEEQSRLLMRDQKSASELTEEGLDRAARLTAKQIEVTQLQQSLTNLKGEGAKGNRQNDTRIEELERRLSEARHQAELEARDRKHAEEIRELKTLIAQRERKSDGPDQISLLLEQMRADRKASDDRFHALMMQMKDEKMNAVLEEVKSLRNKPATQGGSLLEQAEAMLKLRKIFGWGGDDDDDVDDEDDDRPWWEKALDKIGDKLIPKLVSKLDGLEGEGKTVDRATFMKEVEAMAKEAEDAAVANATANAAHRLAMRPVPKLPPPPPAAPAASAVPGAPAAPVAELPPPPPAAPAAPAAPAPAANPVPAERMTIEQEIVIRVAGTLELIEREMTLRPNEYHWNYEGCWTSLPEEILEKVCAAADPVALVDALSLPEMNPEKLAELKAKISGNPRMVAWLTLGLNELKGWWAEKQKDPTFDPFGDEDEEEGGTE